MLAIPMREESSSHIGRDKVPLTRTILVGYGRGCHNADQARNRLYNLDSSGLGAL